MKLLFILLSFCVLFACTITKRHFGSGYHIEWKRNLDQKKSDENPPEKLPLEVSELKESSEEIEAPESYVVTPDTPLKETMGDTVSLIDTQKGDETVKMRCWDVMDRVPTERKRREINNLSPQDPNQPAPEVKKKTEPLTWVSLALLLGIGISIILISIFSSFLYLGTGAFIFGLVLVMFICSLISLIRVIRHPDRYKNKGLTNFIFALSATCLVVAALYFLYVGAAASMNLMM